MTNPYGDRLGDPRLPALVGEVIGAPGCHHDSTTPSGEHLAITPDVDAMVEAMGTTHETLGHFLGRFTDAVKTGAVEPKKITEISKDDCTKLTSLETRLARTIPMRY